MTSSLLARVAEVLRDRRIPFALIGAAAMAAHGVSRSTFDTDLFAVGDAALDDEIWQALASDGVEVDVRHGDDDDPLLGVVRCIRGDEAIDLVVGRSVWQRELIERAPPTRVFALDLPIVLVEDLILLKLYAGGLQDRWDIEQLLATNAVKRADIDARASSLPERSQILWKQLRSS